MRPGASPPRRARTAAFFPGPKKGRFLKNYILKGILSGRSVDDQMQICFPNYEGDRVARALPGPMPAAAPQP